MKNLLIVTDSFLPRWDGIARFLNEVIPKLQDEYNITIACPDYGEIQFEGVNLVRFNPLKYSFGTDYNPCFPSYRKINKLVASSDLVWVQSIGPLGATAIIAARRKKVSIITYQHSLEWELFVRSLGLKGILRPIGLFLAKSYSKYLYNKADLIMIPSVEIGELMRKIGIRTQKTVIHLGTNTEKFVPPHDKAEAKRSMGLDPENFIIGFAGRIGKEKDLRTLYRAFVRVKRRKKNARLLIVGQDRAGITRKFAQDNTTVIVGAVSNVVPYLQAMDVYVLPSLTETTSLSTLEAMSCALPVVSTRVGYVKEYIKDNQNGMFFRKANSYELYKRLMILADSSSIRGRLGTNARQSVIEQFSWEKAIENIRSVLAVF